MGSRKNEFGRGEFVRGRRTLLQSLIVPVLLTAAALPNLSCSWRRFDQTTQSRANNLNSDNNTRELSATVAAISNSPAEAGTPNRNVDLELQRAASRALGDREGTVIVMDPATGRLMAVVNQRLAFEQAYPPGSAIKPFTTLAALRTGVIDRRTRMHCPGAYVSRDFRIVCSHPRSKAAFDLAHALAYSCNYYFAKTAERLSPGEFESVLVSYGFGRRTGVNAPESMGRIPDSGMPLKTALGEGDQILVTPIQLLRAYVALFTGKLFRPRLEPAGGSFPSEARKVDISSDERSVLIQGLRGAVTYGTAMSAGLKSVPLFIYGKTGTSTASNGFRTQGWFVSMAAEKPSAVPMLATLVFLKRSHGSEGAEVAKGVYEEYARLTGAESARREDSPEFDRGVIRAIDVFGETWDRGGHGGPPLQRHPEPLVQRYVATSIAQGKRANQGERQIRVHLVTQNRTETLSLEDYILGVVLAEDSVETELEALKAQAVVSRTYALKNLRRHARDGYDFCSTTHCQRYVDPGQKPELEQLARRAVSETEGQVLVDSRGRLIDAYFGGSCGGMTADIGTLWGVPAPPYLKGVPDPYCRSMPHSRWVQSITMSKMLEALRSDPRTDPGTGLANVKIARRDHTGRAELVEIDGAKHKIVSGWVFKIIVGRSLGWNVLLSSRFDVRRQGNDFVFHGSGFGHGLGLCQEGSHVMASRGFGYRAILSHYFPGTKTVTRSPSTDVSRIAPMSHEHALIYSCRLEPQQDGVRFNEHRHFARAVYVQQSTLSSEHFRLKYPAGDSSNARAALDVLESARRDMLHRLSAASIDFDPTLSVQVIVYSTTQDFMAATGLPWWAAAAAHGSRIDLQPLRVLRRRGIFATTLRHEYAHIVIEKLSHGRAPRWLEEGLAAWFAGEGEMLIRESGIQRPLSPDEIDRGLSKPASQQEMKRLYAAAYRQVATMVARSGEGAVWRQLTLYSNSANIDLWPRRRAV